MDIASLIVRVQTSKLLTDPEKAYWTSNLSHMKPDQIEKLDQILTEAEKLSWNENMQQYVSIAGKAQAALA
jgi:hypothetical protein